MLRGASADALAELTDKVGSSGTLADTETVGDQLFAVASLLRADPALRRVATDASLAGEQKQGLVRQLFEGKIEEGALKLLVDAVERRWTASVDLPNALERLSEVALVKSVGAAASDKLADELFWVAQTISGNPEVQDALSNPARTVDDRAALIETLFGGKVLPATVALTKQSLAGTYGTVATALETYREVAASVRGEAVATVRVVQPMGKDDRERLRSALAKQYGREVHLNEIVDPSVMGGIRIEIADDVIDGTVLSRLDDARRRLAG
jgi:F-type H+-transporting ATPase subunit delta